MANDLNRHECIGRLGQDPEVKYLPSGEAVTNISIACGDSWTDKTSGQKQERTTWVPYVAFGKLAEIMGRYLKKGSKVYVSGKLRVRKWQAQDGTDRYATEIVCDQMQMLDSKPQDGSGAQNSHQAPQHPTHSNAPQQAPQQPQGGFDQFDDDIPF